MRRAVLVVVAGVGLAGTCAWAQPDAPQPQQQQSLPSAPRPQTVPLPSVVTPIAPAIDAPQPTAPAKAETPDPQVATHPAEAAKIEEEDAAANEVADAQTLGSAGTIHVHVYYVHVPFTVKDHKGQQVPGLTVRDVRIYENGLQQKPVYFSTDSVPLSVAFIVDQSVTFDTMGKINASLAALQNAFTKYDEVAVFTYNNGVKMQDGFSAAQGMRLGQILERSKIPGREPVMGVGGPLSQTINKNNQLIDPNVAPVHGSTSMTVYAPKEYHTLNDAILQAAQLLSTADRGRRRLIYVIGEGKEYGSKAKESDVIKYLQRNNIAVYATLVGESAVPGMGFLDRIHLPLTMREDILPRYAAATGGQCDPEWRPNGIQQSFARISETVRTQYEIGYNSSLPVNDNKPRSLEVRVMGRGDLTVIAKQRYIPNPQDTLPSGTKRHLTPPTSPFPTAETK